MEGEHRSIRIFPAHAYEGKFAFCVKRVEPRTHLFQAIGITAKRICLFLVSGTNVVFSGLKKEPNAAMNTSCDFDRPLVMRE
jgi:hypothetical protein